MTPINEEYLISLREDLKQIGSYLVKISKEVVAQEISSYPIYLIHNLESIQLGRPIIKSSASQTNWSINATILEELVKEGILPLDRVKHFKEIYKDPENHICCFMLTPEYQEFVFSPFPIEK